MQALKREQRQEKGAAGSLGRLTSGITCSTREPLCPLSSVLGEKKKSDPQVTSRKAVRRPREVSSQSGCDSRERAGR